MFESLLTTIHQNYGITGLVLFIIVAASIKWADVVTAMIRKIWVSYAKGTLIYSPKSILTSKLTYWIDFKIDRMKIGDLGRELIFKDMLKIYLSEIKEHAFDVENVKGFNELNRRELYQKIVECLHKINVSWQEKALAQNIPQVVINKFNKAHDITIEYILKNAEFISQSPVYKTNRDVINALYIIEVAMLEITIAEAEKTLSVLNGELTGIEYNGVTIGE